MKSINLKKNVIVGSFVFVLGTMGSTLTQAKDVKIGTVDMQRALQNTESGKKARTQLEKEFNNKKQQLQTEETAIKKLAEEFKKQSLVMSDDARAKKQAVVNERIMKFQELTQRSQAEIQQKERELTQPIVTQIKSAIAELAEKRSYTFVAEKNENTVLYSLSEDDLTDDVVSAVDKKKSK
jgi:outer membrane protein